MHSSIEREMHIEAAPEVVYEVISTPEHLREWWPDEADIKPVPGATGTISFGEAKIEQLTVVEADPPRRFSFRWVYEEGATAGPGNSLLATFELVPSGTGTLLCFTETGFQERDWAPAEAEQHHRDHTTGWDHFLPRLDAYIARLTSTS